MTKIIKHRKLPGLESSDPVFHDLIAGAHIPLSHLLEYACFSDRLYACGPLDKMTREWMREPLAHGWKFGREFAFKHRTAVYQSCEDPAREVSVKLISHRESWFPGCENAKTARDAWDALKSEWRSTGLPLLSSPAATGRALLWETLPNDRDGNPVEFPSLDDNLARLIRANSPQHRIEVVTNADYVAGVALAQVGDVSIGVPLTQYDGRWMYAAFCGLDRFPIGEARRSPAFRPYVPGIYDVTVKIPDAWAHIGLLPRLEDDGNVHTRAWRYPSEPGRIFRTWAFEPELTLAIQGVKKLEMPAWEIVDFHDGWEFDKGRPLAGWSAKLIEMRERLERSETGFHFGGGEIVNHFSYARAAIRQILNHTIGSIHKNEFERETFVSDDNFRKWRRENPHLAGGDDVVEVEGGYLVPCFVPDTSRLSIFMPHWSSTLYSLARARVAEWALKCKPETLVKIHGDAIYSTCEQPELDKFDTGRLGQPRRKQ